MTSVRSRLALIGGILCILLAVGCSGLKSIHVRGVKPLNVNPNGESTPVRVRIYLLKGDGKFRKATFEDLWSKDLDVLGDDLLREPMEEDIFPGEETDRAREILLGDVSPETRFVGVLALYSEKSDRGGPRHVVLDTKAVKSSVFVFTGYEILFRSR